MASQLLERASLSSLMETGSRDSGYVPVHHNDDIEFWWQIEEHVEGSEDPPKLYW